MVSIHMAYAFVAICVLVLAIGQLLFKAVSLRLEGLGFNALYTDLHTMVLFGAAASLYAASTILWIQALRTLSLSGAYPFMALGFVIVPLGAAFFFNETLTIKYFLGLALLLTGLLVINSA